MTPALLPTRHAARACVWALGLLLALTGAAPASAQAPASAPAPALKSADAREAFRRGEAAYSAGNYEGAIREWNAAYEADPRPRIQFNLSQAYERLGQLENAITALESFLNSGDPDDPTYSDANARLLALRQRLEGTGVKVTGGSEGGLIKVDEQDWGRTPRPDKITVAPGSHVLTVSWPDGREFRTSVYVPAGQVVEVQVADPEGGKTSTTDTASAGASAGGAARSGGMSPATKRKVILYSVGGGLAGIGTGLLVYGIVRKSATSDCSDSDRAGTIYCDPDDRDAADRQGVAGLVTGSVLLAGGVAMIVVAAVTGKNADKQAKTQCGIGFASAACRFRF